MIQVVLLGTGNVASYLFEAFANSGGAEVIQVYNHALPSLADFKGKVEITTSLDELADADVYLLALKDDALSTVAEALQEQQGLVVHTSGAAPMSVLRKFRRHGVFYPLQTFSKTRSVTNREIPFCLEGNSEKDLELLKRMASAISGKAYEVSTEQRKKLHLVAVFVCNFVNHLYSIGENICQNNELPFDILRPLIQETADKIDNASPSKVQTGPAIRGDNSSIQTHLMLLDSEENKEIYKLLTQSIQNHYGKKL